MAEEKKSDDNTKTLEQSKILFDLAMADMPFAKDVHDVEPVEDESGFPLDQMDAYDLAFKKMYEDMFSRTSEMGVMGAGDFEARLRSLQNELSKVMTEKGNEGCTSLLSFGGQTLHTSEPPDTQLHSFMQVPTTGDFLHPTEEGSFAYDAEADDERSGSPVDSGSVL